MFFSCFSVFVYVEVCVFVFFCSCVFVFFLFCLFFQGDSDSRGASPMPIGVKIVGPPLD